MTDPIPTGLLFAPDIVTKARTMAGLPPIPVPTKTQQIDQMLEHLKSARRIAYDLGLHTTSDMISKPIVSTEMAMGALRAAP